MGPAKVEKCTSLFVLQMTLVLLARMSKKCIVPSSAVQLANHVSGDGIGMIKTM